MKEYLKATCRGSYVFGTACGKCERCEEEKQQRKKLDKEKQFAMQGWQCPVCGSVYAPFVNKCDNSHVQISYSGKVGEVPPLTGWKNNTTF